jgi:hypothetical protein
MPASAGRRVRKFSQPRGRIAERIEFLPNGALYERKSQIDAKSRLAAAFSSLRHFVAY